MTQDYQIGDYRDTYRDFRLQAPQRFKGQVARVATAIQRGDANGALTAIAQKNSGSKQGDNASQSKSAGEKSINTNSRSRLQPGVHLWPESQLGGRELQQLAKESFLPIFEAQIHQSNS